MPISGVKSSLGYVLILDPELVIPRINVYLEEGPCTSKLVKEIIYPGKRVMIVDRYLI